MPENSAQPAPVRWVRFDSRSRNVNLPLQGSQAHLLRKCEIVSAGLDFLEGHFRAGTSCSPTHMVWGVLGGTVWCDGGDGPRKMREGELAICSARGPHWIELAGKKARGVWFHLRDGSRWASLRRQNLTIRSTPQVFRLGALMDGYLAETSSAPARRSRLAHAYGQMIAWTLQRELEETDSLALRLNARLESLWAAVDLDLRDDWSVSRLAERLQVSCGYLHRLCRQKYGVGPIKRVTELRMAVARTLLIQTDLRLDDIADRLGYGTAYSFSHAFLRETGLRPGIFRQNALRQVGKTGHDVNF